MTPNRWQRVKAVLDEVLQCPPDEREARLEALCGDDPSLRAEVESLLDAEADAPAFLDDTVEHWGPSFLSDLPPDDGIGPSDRVGAYRLVEEIGAGGMGVVYRAERADGHFERQVALKVLPRYFETDERVARFRAERQILASLDHPNIARLLDGGVTPAGHPYLVMEYVEGRPLSVYCAEEDVSLDERLRLLQTIGRAVHHAHSNLVVHRDLKPSNILVTEDGTVKLLDFGIAKLLDAEATSSPTTDPEQLLMTPEYAAPEQVRGDDVTTAVDVYQLGVLAYELLVDRRPFHVEGRHRPEIERAVLKTDPTRPSTAVQAESSSPDPRVPRPPAEWSRALRGDLDHVVMKALRKEPDRRYDSAQALVDDLERVLTNRPVQAKPATVRYRIRKFAQRHHRGVLAALAGVAVLVGLSALYAVQIQNQRDRARAEAQKSAEVTSFLMDLFEANAPAEALGDTLTANQLLRRGLERADALSSQPDVQAQMLDVIGQIHGRLGNYDDAESVLRRAVRIHTRIHGPQARETVDIREHLGMLLGDAGRYEEAERLLREVLETRDAVLRGDALPRAETERRLAYVLRRQGKYEEAKTLLQESLPVVEAQAGERSKAAVSTKSSLGVVLQNIGEYHRAESLYRDVLAERRRRLDAPHPTLAMSVNSLASLLMNVGQLEEAEALFKEALAMRTVLFGPTHPKVALTLNNLGLVHREQERYEEAESHLRRALSIRRDQLGDDHLSVAIGLFGLADLLHRTDRPRRALDAYREALALFREHLGPDHSFTARAQMGLGSVHHALGNRREAAEALREGFDRVRRIHPESSLEYALEAGRLGRYHLERGDSSRAKALLERGLSTLREIEASPTPRQRRMERALLSLSDDADTGR